MSQRVTYIVYDSRAAGGEGSDEASVYCTAETLVEAREDVRTMFPDGEIYKVYIVDDVAVKEEWIPRSYARPTPRPA